MSARRVFVGVVASLIVLSIAWSTKAQAEVPRSATQANATAMGQSLNAQLRDHTTSFEFAIERNGALELTGHADGADPSAAVGLVRSAVFTGDAEMCHLELGGLEAALVVFEPAASLAQPCAILADAYDAALA